MKKCIFLFILTALILFQTTLFAVNAAPVEEDHCMISDVFCSVDVVVSQDTLIDAVDSEAITTSGNYNYTVFINPGNYDPILCNCTVDANSEYFVVANEYVILEDPLYHLRL